MKGKRVSRISSEVKRVVSELIRTELRDPRISDMTSITDVEVTSDLSYANIFISVYGDEEVKKESMDGLNNAKGFIKKELGERLDLRHIPEVVFKLDDTVDKGMRIEELISSLHSEEEDEG